MIAMTIRNALASLAALGCVAGCSAAPAGAEDVASTESALGSFSYQGGFVAFGGSFTPPYDGICVVVSGASLATQRCVGGISGPQTFHLYNNNAITDNSGRCVRGNATTGVVDLATCDGSYAQKWDMRGANVVWLADESKCLDVQNGSSASGTRLDVIRCNGTQAQVFFPFGFTMGIASTMSDQSTFAPQCLDVRNDGEYSGNIVDNYDCNRTNAQWWVLTEEGRVQLANNRNLCLTASPGLATIQTCGAVDWRKQTWTMTNRLYDTAMVSLYYGTCLTVSGANRTPGALVDLEACAAVNDQRWVPFPAFQSP